MSAFRPATHLSSAYHRSSATFPLGRSCDNADCTHRDHVPAYPFYCQNPHCLHPAHRQEETTMSEHRCDHQFCPVCIERVKREDARVTARNIIGVYQMDGQRYDVYHSEGGYRIENLETGLRSVQMTQEETERVLREKQYQKLTGYEVVDGQAWARHQTGQFCDCEECTGPDLTGAYDQVAAIMAYEQGDLDEDETIELFAALVETGVAWQLQGSYGRTAMALIEAGLIGARV